MVLASLGVGKIYAIGIMCNLEFDPDPDRIMQEQALITNITECLTGNPAKTES